MNLFSKVFLTLSMITQWIACPYIAFADVRPMKGLPLYYWQDPKLVNFGDYLSLKLMERIVDGAVKVYKKDPKVKQQKILAVGSILFFAEQGDIVWGSGINGRKLAKSDYSFQKLDIRSVRGPLSHKFLQENFGINAPKIYGDPALLMPYFFPEYQRKENPKYDYIVIPHYTEEDLFPQNKSGNIVYPSDPWDLVVMKILDSKFVIASSLHGIIVAEAYGIPARLIRVTENEPFFKYKDYYWGTGRMNFQFATSIEEALLMGGEVPYKCDLEKIYDAFPFDVWPHIQFKKPDFSKDIRE